MPESQVERLQALNLHDAFESDGSDACAAVQVGAPQLLQVVSDEDEAAVSDAAALTDVERGQLVRCPCELADAVIADVTGAHAERAQSEQALCDVAQRRVPDPLAETEVERREARAAALSARRQETNPDVADAVTAAQVEVGKVREVRQ